MPDMDVGSGRVQTELDPQRHTGCFALASFDTHSCSGSSSSIPRFDTANAAATESVTSCFKIGSSLGKVRRLGGQLRSCANVRVGILRSGCGTTAGPFQTRPAERHEF
jgi:hypothetical protein